MKYIPGYRFIVSPVIEEQKTGFNPFASFGKKPLKNRTDKQIPDGEYTIMYIGPVKEESGVIYNYTFVSNQGLMIKHNFNSTEEAENWINTIASKVY